LLEHVPRGDEPRLPASVGVGKGTVTLDDFEHADLLLIFGQNPATNHPRMLGELRECAKRGATIVSINPLKERGLERFADPQSPLEMLTMSGTKIASTFIQPTIGGDFALLKGIAKRVLELDDAARAAGTPRVLDTAFIDTHTAGFDAFAADLRDESWAALSAESGVPYEQIDALAQRRAQRTGDRDVGNGHHAAQALGRDRADADQPDADARQHRPAGRGPVPGARPFERAGQPHGRHRGKADPGVPRPARQSVRLRAAARARYDVVETIEAMRDGRVKVLIGLGGNFAMATPDTPRTWEGMRRCDLTVHITTKLNRSHLIHGRDALILPTLGRTEIDLQDGVAQGVTVEDSMSMVHVSYGMNQPASANLMSEPAIVAHLGHALFGSGTIDWLAYKDDYAKIRDAIEATFDGFHDYNARIARPGGFHLRVASRDREWLTPTGKANFIAHALPADTPIQRARALHGERLMTLMTTRSHDQYNTTVYGLDDRYRGVYGQRRVVFVNRDDLAMLGLQAGEWVDMETVWHDGIVRRADGFLLVEYDIPRGCIGAYYPETNPLVPLDSVGDVCNTPTSKSVPVLLHRAAAPAAAAA
jgi:anaerobic selenocysteine-containing dehydrogenase